MPAFLCSQCSAPLPMEAVQGFAPCGYCGAINAPPADLNAPRRFDNGPAALHGAPSRARLRVCPACRHENQAHYKFCLGCGRELPEASSPG